MKRVTILVGDVREKLRELPETTVHCVVTSPPYWGLRDYGTPPQVWGGDAECEHEWGNRQKKPVGHLPSISSTLTTNNGRGPKTGDKYAPGPQQFASTGAFCRKCNAWLGNLGLEPTVELYVEHMVEVFREVRRVLRDDGTLWLNMGDCYAGKPPGCANGGVSESSTLHGVRGISDTYRETLRQGCGQKRDTTGGGLKPKDLVGQPWRVAFALQADGWYLRSDIIWAKPNPMPESCRDRPTKAHEYVFLLTKSGAATFWTHRDDAGTRKQPEPDYRWVDQAAEYLFRHRADVWGKRIAATFKALGFSANLSRVGQVVETSEEPNRWRTEPFPEIPKGWPPCSHEKRWRRLNLWRAHDYFFDQEAVREKSSSKTNCPAQASRGEKTRLNREAGDVSGSGWADAETPYRPSARNIRTVWTIPTQPFPEAHFATFPEKLVQPCIKAGTSEKGCCPKCWAPWVRVISPRRHGERRVVPEGWDTGPGAHGTRGTQAHQKRRDEYEGKHAKATETTAARRILKNVRRARVAGGEHDNPFPPKQTTGWRPSCDCPSRGGFTVPCTVLDPFAGSGTTGLVAAKLGRRAVLIELKSEYAAMAERRCNIEVQTGLFQS